jgi:hypothetical protein
MRWRNKLLKAVRRKKNKAHKPACTHSWHNNLANMTRVCIHCREVERH